MPARLITLLAIGLLLAVTLGAPGRGASAVTSAGEPIPVNLDAFRADNSEASAIGPVLDDGKDYEVTATGTFSKWPKSQWIDDGVCAGTTESAPMFPSPGTDNGPVALDADWRFATPVGSSVCSHPLPSADSSFRISADGGANYEDLTADNSGSSPNPEHNYVYTVTGHGQRIAFLLRDDRTDDNYGVLHITIGPPPTPLVDSVEFTQGIQELQTLGGLQASLGGANARGSRVGAQAFPGENGKIAFVCRGTGEPEVCTMNPDGSDVVNISNNPGGPDGLPRWSGDGSELVFASVRNGVRGIYLMDADGSDVRLVIALKHGGFPSPSPDGTKVAYEDFTSGGIGIYVVNADGSGNTLITPERDWVAGYPSWSPDGTKIALEATDASQDPHASVSGLYVMNANGSDLHPLTTAGDGFYSDWSPDGSMIVHTGGENGVNVVRVTPATGGASSTLAVNAWLPGWSPDGTKIVYSRVLTGQDGLSIMNADGSNQTVITTGGEDQPNWGPFGKVVNRVEFTQGVQQLQSIGALQADLAGDGAPPVPIVAGKPAVMRIYMSEVQTTIVYELEATGDVNGSRFVQLDPGCTPGQRRKREGFCKSVDFFFTPPAGSWSVTLKVRLQQDSDVLEEHEFHLTSVETVPLVLKPVTVCDRLLDASTGTWNCGSLFNFVQQLAFLRATFPGEVSVAGSSATVYTDTGEIPPMGDWWQVIGDNVRSLWTADGGFDNLYEYGIVRPEADAGTTGGIAFDVANAAAGKTSLLRDDLDGGLPVETGDELVAHLLGDNMGLGHAPSSAGCYGQPAAVDPSWPNAGSPAIGEIGFDVAQDDPIPDTDADWTSFCTPRWISPYTANNVIDAFGPATARTAQSAGLTQGDFWLVSGRINEDEHTAEFDPIFQQETLGSTEAGTGPYRIEVRDSGDSVLFTRFFLVDRALKEDEGPEAIAPDVIVHFGELVPVQANAATIVVFSANQEVGHVDLGGMTPVVTLTSGVVRAGAPPLPEFSWSVDDGDSAAHGYLLQLSKDDGATWVTIAPRYEQTSFSVDPALVGGGEGLRLRVLASDGANTGMAVSEPFNLQHQAPQGAIVSPGSGASFHTGDLVWLQAAIVDPEDGFLDGASVHWTSSRDGALGTGASLPVYDLSAGTHTIMLSARDSDGNELADSITVTVSGGPIVEGEPQTLSGDINCSGGVDSVDALGISRFVAGLAVSQTQPCPAIGSAAIFGDVNCSGGVDAVDSLFVLRFVAGLPVNLPGGCREIGT